MCIGGERVRVCSDPKVRAFTFSNDAMDFKIRRFCLYACVYVYVCVYACMSVCLSVCMYVCTHIHERPELRFLVLALVFHHPVYKLAVRAKIRFELSE